VACGGRVKVGVDRPLELVKAAAEGPQLNNIVAGTPVIIPEVARVNVVQVEEMTGRLPLGVAGKVCWKSVTP